MQNPSCEELLRASRPEFPEGLRVLVVMKDMGLHSSAKKVLEEIGYKVTTVATLETGLTTLESAAAAGDNFQFDVALVESQQVEPLLGAVVEAAEGDATGKNTSATTPTVADVAKTALSDRFRRLAAEVAIVLMHVEDDVSSKSYMIEAIKVGVVDVVKFPLAKQSMRTLWQHAVRKIIRQQGGVLVGGGMVLGNRLALSGGGPFGKRSADESGLRLKMQGSGGSAENTGGSNSEDSSASEERAIKRQTSSPTTVLEDGANADSAAVGAAGIKGGAAAAAAKGVNAASVAVGKKGVSVVGAAKKGSEEDKKGNPAAVNAGVSAGAANAAVPKQKPQARSTQQWKAAEQRGRRLAIKPHTAVVQAQNPNGQVMGGMQGMGYWQPAPGQQGAVMGQTQTMNINGQSVQVWMPMNGVYHHPQQQQQGQQQQGQQQQQQQQQQNGQQQQADQSTSENNNNNNGASNTGENNNNGQQQQTQNGGYMYSPGGMITAVGPNGQPMHMQPMNGGYGQMVLVQQANGQQVYMQQSSGMHQMANGQMVMQGQGQWVGGQQQYYQMAGDQQGQQGGDGKGGQQQQQQQNGYYAQNGPGMPQQMQPQPMPTLDPMPTDLLKTQPLPLGLNLKRTNSMQQLMGGGSLADTIGSPNAGGGGVNDPLSSSLFGDVDMLEEDALDAILAQAKDGTLLSFDGMDEAMLEAAAAGSAVTGGDTETGMIQA